MCECGKKHECCCPSLSQYRRINDLEAEVDRLRDSNISLIADLGIKDAEIALLKDNQKGQTVGTQINIGHKPQDVNHTELPLRCHVVDGAIHIEIGVNVLKFTAAQHPQFWDGESAPNVPGIKITDANVFAEEVASAMNDEYEDGSTLLTRMLDQAILDAVSDGCGGVDHEG